MRNKVESLKDDAGVWVEDKEELKELALKFYTELFSSDPNTGGEFCRGAFLRLEKGVKLKLEEIYTSEEVSMAVKQMWSLKAPGHDGFQPIFFKQTCNVTGPSLVRFILGALNGEAVPEEAAGALLVLFGSLRSQKL